MSLRGVRIEKGPRFWHVSVKNTDSNAGYVERDRFITPEDAFLLAAKLVEEAIEKEAQG